MRKENERDEFLELVRGAIDIIFSFLESTDYGLSEDRQEVEAYFWERFMDYFLKLQKTEKNRVLNQLSDLL